MGAIHRLVPFLCALAFTTNAQTWPGPTVAVQQDVSVYTQATSPPPTISVERKVSIFTQSTPPTPSTSVVTIVNEPTTSIATTIVTDKPTTSQAIVRDVPITTEASETPSTESIAVDAVKVTTVRPAIAAAGATVAARVPRQIDPKYAPNAEGRSKRQNKSVIEYLKSRGKRSATDVEGMDRLRRFAPKADEFEAEDDERSKRQAGFDQKMREMLRSRGKRSATLSSEESQDGPIHSRGAEGMGRVPRQIDPKYAPNAAGRSKRQNKSVIEYLRSRGKRDVGGPFGSAFGRLGGRAKRSGKKKIISRQAPAVEAENIARREQNRAQENAAKTGILAGHARVRRAEKHG